jgi:tripartite-type tricarboxylate transporter receptor subunit TctC
MIAPTILSASLEAKENAVKHSRRALLGVAASAAIMPAMSRFSWAETYPTRPVHMFSGFFAGGLTDIVARLMSQWLSERFGQPFIVEDLAGAGTNLATEQVVRARPDGYTFLMASSSNAINATLYAKLNFDFVRDTVPIASVARTPLVMVVNPSFPAKTVPEFIAYAKANPGKINMASPGIGSSVHLAGELFMTMAGVKFVVVQYRSSYVPDLLAGQVQFVFSPIPTTIQQIQAGKLRALAVTGETRSPTLPDVPTVGEFITNYEATVWNGVVAPKNTPQEVIDKVSSAINSGLTDPKMVTELSDLGSVPKPMSPDDFGKFIVEDTAKWGKVIQDANIERM